MITINFQVIDLYHPLALRLFLLGTHYRSPINYSDLLLESASDRIFYIYQVLQHAIFIMINNGYTDIETAIVTK